MARRGHHRDGVSERILFDLRDVPGLFPTPGTFQGLISPEIRPGFTIFRVRLSRFCDIIPPMHSATRVALVGDFNELQRAHQAIPRALSAATEGGVETVWISTDSVARGDSLAGFDGIWCVPGMPYRNADGAISAIRFARTGNLPFLGTSAGFQYALIEFARNVMGFTDADHQKSNPKTAMPLISPLGC